MFLSLSVFVALATAEQPADLKGIGLRQLCGMAVKKVAESDFFMRVEIDDITPERIDRIEAYTGRRNGVSVAFVSRNGQVLSHGFVQNEQRTRINYRLGVYSVSAGKPEEPSFLDQWYETQAKTPPSDVWSVQITPGLPIVWQVHSPATVQAISEGRIGLKAAQVLRMASDPTTDAGFWSYFDSAQGYLVRTDVAMTAGDGSRRTIIRVTDFEIGDVGREALFDVAKAVEGFLLEQGG
ncbi:hypothetical protein QPK87_19840 [Kamptonema cortianum]|nr:hypothetical protein [Geitlerinema splendidum]MDK3158810.1 hypothetical protein [Kamptonema cortianum]